MTREEAKQKLETIFSSAFEEDHVGAEKVISSYNKLKVSEYRKQGKTTEDLSAAAAERLKALPVMNMKQEGEVITMMVGSGFGDRNPTILEIVIRGSEVTVSGWAKEGVIPQGSAKKAVNAAMKALGM